MTGGQPVSNILEVESEPSPRPVAEPHRAELMRVFVHVAAVYAEPSGERGCIDEGACRQLVRYAAERRRSLFVRSKAGGHLIARDGMTPGSRLPLREPRHTIRHAPRPARGL